MGDLHKLGPRGEDYALELLRRRGHKLLERNFRCPQGEIDLVTWQKDTLVFTEVRAREAHETRSPVESITPAKQRRILRAATAYLLKRVGNKQPPPCRYDVVWVTASAGKITEGGVLEGMFST